MKEKYHNSIVNGVNKNNFPRVPVDYGYRDSTNFWYTKFKKPISEKIPEKNDGNVKSVVYAAERIDPEVKFTEEACAKLVKIPRIFLKAALTQMVKIAKEEGISLIDEKALEIINDEKRKNKKLSTKQGVFRTLSFTRKMYEEKNNFDNFDNLIRVNYYRVVVCCFLAKDNTIYKRCVVVE